MDIQESSHWYRNIDNKHCVIDEVTKDTVVIYYPSSGLCQTYSKFEFLGNFHQHVINTMRR